MRHGSSFPLKDINYREGKEIGLTPEGKQEIQRASKIVAKYSPEIIYSSPLRRTYESSLILKKNLGIPIKFDGRLKERIISFEEKDYERINEIKKKMYLDFDYSHRDGESINQIGSRMMEFIKEKTEENYENMIIVGHNHALENLWLELFKDKQSFILNKYQFLPAEIKIIQVVEGKYVLDKIPNK